MSDNIRVITNNIPRPIIDGYELSADERAEFDYLDWTAVDNGEAGYGFIRFKGQLYDLGEFMTTSGLPEFNPLRQWDGYHSDSFFSGILVRYVQPEQDHVIMGWYLS